MDVQRIARRYISAWNRQDAEGVLALMHKGASYFDAFWMETCVGEDLPQYFHDSFQDELYRYEQAGDILVVGQSVIYRYNAYERSESKTGQAVFNGAEVLVLRENKIITVSDHYCDPHRDILVEVGRLAAKRHGEATFVKSGLGAQRVSSYRNQLSALMNQDKLYLDPNLTLSHLADQMGCSTNHLAQVINSEFGTSFHKLLDQHRARHARELLHEESDDPLFVMRVGVQSGFRSIENFNSSFRKSFGVTPAQFHNSLLYTQKQTVGK